MTLAPRAAMPFLLPLLLFRAAETPAAKGAPAPAGDLVVAAQERPRSRVDPAAILLPPLPFWERVESFFLPEYLAHMYRLRRFIADDAFPAQFGALSSRARIDAIWLAAVKITEGNPFESLLVACFATLPYRTFDAIVPLVQWVITIPVSTESREEFRRRLRHLPAGFLPDSPPGGDQDKLPHFFGSAYLACVTKSPATAYRAGVWVETLESIFKLEGFSDERDIRMGERGIDFARALLAHRDLLPSDVLPRIPTNSDR